MLRSSFLVCVVFIFCHEGTAETQILKRWTAPFETYASGQLIRKIGDLDNDDIEDFLLSGYSTINGPRSGIIRAVSGRTGEELYTVVGEADESLGELLVPGEDVNGDGVPDFAAPSMTARLYSNLRDPHRKMLRYTKVFSGKDGTLLYRFKPGGRTIDDIALPGDLDGDGRSEIVILRYRPPSHQRYKVLVYSGANGRLLKRYLLPDGADIDFESRDSALLSVGDLTKDGRPDLLIGLNGGYPSRFVPHSGSGAAVIFSPVNGLMRVIKKGKKAGEHVGTYVANLGDLNGDGMVEFQIDHAVYSGKTKRKIFSLNRRKVVLRGTIRSAGDRNGDGVADFLVKGFFVADGEEPYEEGWRLFSGKDRSRLSFTNVPYGDIAFLNDRDNDGLREVLVTSAQYDGDVSGAYALYSGQDLEEGEVFFRGQYHSFNLGSFGDAIAVGDFDGDSYDDVAVGDSAYDSDAGSNVGRVSVISGRTLEIVREVQGSQPFERVGFHLATAGDVDGNGSQDLAVTSGYWLFEHPLDAPQVRIFSGDLSQVLFLSEIEADRYRNFDRLFSLGDVDADGRSDFALSVLRPDIDNWPIFRPYDVDGEKSLPGLPNWFRWASSLGDVNHDSLTDFLVGGVNHDDASYYDVVEYSLGTPSYVPLDSAGFVSRLGYRPVWNSHNVGDLNSDGYDEILLSSGANAAVFSGRNGSTVFDVPTERGRDILSAHPMGDADRDGVLDFLLVTQVYHNGLHIHSGRTGKRVFSFNLDCYFLANRSNIRTLGDISNDGNQDIIVGCPLATDDDNLNSGEVLLMSAIF